MGVREGDCCPRRGPAARSILSNLRHDFIMILTIEYEDSYGIARSFWIRQHEAVTVGSSVQADQQIEGDQELDRLHFHLHYQDGRWMLQAVSDRPIKLNGEYRRLSVLQDGDRILAGRTMFSVVLPTDPNAPDLDESSQVTSDTVSFDTPLDPVLDWWRGLNRRESRLEAAVLEYCVEGVEEHFLELLPTFGSIGATALVWNRRAFQDPDATLAGWNVVEEDLFSKAPPEIRKEHSLAVGPVEWERCDIQELAVILRSDTAMLLIHSTDISELIENKRVMWGWYAKPSLLQFHLRNGSEMLVSQLIKAGETLAIVPKSGRDLYLYGNSNHLHGMSFLTELSF